MAEEDTQQPANQDDTSATDGQGDAPDLPMEDSLPLENHVPLGSDDNNDTSRDDTDASDEKPQENTPQDGAF